MLTRIVVLLTHVLPTYLTERNFIPEMFVLICLDDLTTRVHQAFSTEAAGADG